MYNVYNAHRGSNTKLPTVRSVEEARSLADAAAEICVDAFYRVFERTSESVTGERFVTAFSVLGGKVTEHESVAIPSAHF